MPGIVPGTGNTVPSSRDTAEIKTDNFYRAKFKFWCVSVWKGVRVWQIINK